MNATPPVAQSEFDEFDEPHRFGEPRTITVALTRDLERATVAPRLPGIERIINAAIEAEITAAETTLSVDVIR